VARLAAEQLVALRALRAQRVANKIRIAWLGEAKRGVGATPAASHSHFAQISPGGGIHSARLAPTGRPHGIQQNVSAA
jgi:hypothetical protein